MMALMRARRCACGTTYTVLEHGGQTLTIESEDGRNSCPSCGSLQYTAHVVAAKPVDLDYPRFDRGLGLTLTSAAHRRQVCKERGLIPVDGDWDHERMAADQRREFDELERQHDEYVKRLDHAPEYAEYREMRSKPGLMASIKRRSLRGAQND